jgi:hypothetical protein
MVDVQHSLFKAKVVNSSTFKSQVLVIGIYLGKPIPRSSWLLVFSNPGAVLFTEAERTRKHYTHTYPCKVFS